MRVDRINYQKTFNLGNYTSERIGMEAELESGESAEEQLLILKKAVEDLHRSNNPGFYVESIPYNEPPMYNGSSSSTHLPSIDYKAKERLEILIDDSANIEQLIFYELDAEKCGLK